MKIRSHARLVAVAVAAFAAAIAVQSLVSDVRAASGSRHCPRGVRSCSAAQVGQPCDPNNLNVICSAQANGSYCCLAYAP